MKIVTGAITAIFLLVSVSALAQTAVPSSGVLGFDYSGDSGRMDIDLTLDVRPGSRITCNGFLEANVSYVGDLVPVSERPIGRFIPITKKTFSVILRRLPAVEMKAEDPTVDPVATAQMRIVCRNRKNVKVADFTTNAAARYVMCGKGTEEVAPGRFLAEMKRKFNEAIE